MQVAAGVRSQSLLLRPVHSRRTATPFQAHQHTRSTRTVSVAADISDAADNAASVQTSETVEIVQSSIQSTAEALQITPPLLAAGIGAAGILIGALVWAASKPQQGMVGSSADDAAADVPALVPEDAVLVFGSTGKLGRLIVKQLLAAGRNVVAAARSDAKVEEAFAGLDGDGAAPGRLFVRTRVDITNAETLGDELLEGVSQIVSAVGPVFGRTPDGKMGYLEDMTSERVDAQGVKNIAGLAQRLPAQRADATQVLAILSAEDMQLWRQLDDTIMGGQSSSKLEAAADGSGAVWTGDLIVEGGGFCGARTESRNLDLGAYDGIRLCVRGDGQTYKLNLKTADQESAPESTYQAQFDTVAGEWTTVSLPWHEFVPVKRAQVDRSKPVVDPAEVRQFGLVLSRFEFNGFENANHKPGTFRLEIQGGISAYRAARPALVAISTAAVERNAVIGDDVEARKADIPIVQLNPGGVLNHKYAGECAVRAARVPYAVVRATGLTSEDEDTSFLLEARQGDAISGKVARAEVASVVAEALGTPTAAGKTFELRRSEAADARGKVMLPSAFRQLFLGLALDRHRPRIGLLPFPKAVPPPPPPSEERKQEILSDDRVQSAMKAGRGGRVRSEEETAAASSVTVTSDGRAPVSPAPEPAAASAATSAGPSAAEDAAPSQSDGQQSAREWIQSWRLGQDLQQAAADGEPAVGRDGEPDAGSAEQQQSAKEWIDSWRSKQH